MMLIVGCSIFTWRRFIYREVKERKQQVKTDIPAVFIALKKKETPIIAKILQLMQLVMFFRQLI